VGTPDKNGQIPKKRYTKWFDYDRMSHRLTFRKRRSGDYLRLSDGSRKKLNRLLIDEKVSRTDRDQLMLLADGDHVVWIPALDRISDDLKITGQTTHILEIQLEEITDERKS
jgi:tRNA(Ile)-lysidine synthase